MMMWVLLGMLTSLRLALLPDAAHAFALVTTKPVAFGGNAFAFVSPTFVPRTRTVIGIPDRQVCPAGNSAAAAAGALHASVPDKYKTSIDGNILVPERLRRKLIIFNGGTDPGEQDWVYKGDKKEKKNVLWEMKLRNAKGVSEDDMDEYNELWPDPEVEGNRSNTINDARRVIHNGEIHIAVCGSAGDAVALYTFKSKKCVFWSKTVGKRPHDVEYIPEKKGYLAVADAIGSGSTIDLYDVKKSEKAYVKGGSVKHPGVHSVVWDATLKRLWGWGNGSKGLRKYEVKFNEKGKPRLELDRSYKVDLEEGDIELGTGENRVYCPARCFMCVCCMLHVGRP